MVDEFGRTPNFRKASGYMGKASFSPLGAVDDFIQGLPRTDDEVADKAKGLYDSAVDYFKDVGKGVQGAVSAVEVKALGGVDMPQFQESPAYKYLQKGADVTGRGIGTQTPFEEPPPSLSDVVKLAATASLPAPVQQKTMEFLEPKKSPESKLFDRQMATAREDLDYVETADFARETLKSALPSFVSELVDEDFDRRIAKRVPDRAQVQGIGRQPTPQELVFARRKGFAERDSRRDREKFIKDYEARTGLVVDRDVLDQKTKTSTGSIFDQLSQFSQAPAAEADIQLAAVRRLNSDGKISPKKILEVYEAERDATAGDQLGSLPRFEKRTPSGDYVGTENLRKAYEVLESRAKKGELSQDALTVLGVTGSKAIEQARREGKPATLLGSQLSPEEAHFVKYNPLTAIPFGIVQEISDLVSTGESQLAKTGAGLHQAGRTLVNIFAAPKGEKTGAEAFYDFAERRIRDPEQLARDAKLMRLPSDSSESKAAKDYIAKGLMALPDDALNVLVAPFMMAYEGYQGMVAPKSIENKMDSLGRVASDLVYMISESVADPKYAFQKGPVTQALNIAMLTGGPVVGMMRRNLKRERMRLEAEIERGNAQAGLELDRLNKLESEVLAYEQNLEDLVRKEAEIKDSVAYAEQAAGVQKRAMELEAQIADVKKRINAIQRKTSKAQKRKQQAETELGGLPARESVERTLVEGETSLRSLKNSLTDYGKSSRKVARLESTIASAEMRAKKAPLKEIDAKILAAERKYSKTGELVEQQSQFPSAQETLRVEMQGIADEIQRLRQQRAEIQASPMSDPQGRVQSLRDRLAEAKEAQSAAKEALVSDYRNAQAFSEQSLVRPGDAPVASALDDALALVDDVVLGSGSGKRLGSIDGVSQAVGPVIRATRGRTKSLRDQRAYLKRLEKKVSGAITVLDDTAKSLFETVGEYRDVAGSVVEFMRDAKGKTTLKPEPSKLRTTPDPIDVAAFKASKANPELDAVIDAMMNPRNADAAIQYMKDIATEAKKSGKTERVMAQPTRVDGYKATKLPTLVNELLDIANASDDLRAKITDRMSETANQTALVNYLLDAQSAKIEMARQKATGLGLTDPVSELGLTLVTEMPKAFFGASHVLSLPVLANQFINLFTYSKSNPKSRYYLMKPSERVSEFLADLRKEAELTVNSAELGINKALENIPRGEEISASQYLKMQHAAADRMPTGESFFGPNPDKALLRYSEQTGLLEPTPLGKKIAAQSPENQAYFDMRIAAMNEALGPMMDLSASVTKQAVELGLLRDPSTLNELWWREQWQPKSFLRAKNKQEELLNRARKEFPQIEKAIQAEMSATAGSDFKSTASTSALRANHLRRAAREWERREDKIAAQNAERGFSYTRRDNPYRIEARERLGLLSDIAVEAKKGLGEMFGMIAEFRLYRGYSRDKTGKTLTQSQINGLKRAVEEGRLPENHLNQYIDIQKTLKAEEQWLGSDMAIPAYGELNGILTIDPKTGKASWKLREGKDKLYMRADDFYEMVAAKNIKKQMSGLVARLTSKWKIGIVAYSPMTAVRNIWSNVFMFAPMANNSILNPANLPHYAKALVDSLKPSGKRSKDWQIGAERGVYNTTYNKAEMSVLDGAVKPFRKKHRDGAEMVESMFEAMTNLGKDPAAAKAASVKAGKAGARLAATGIKDTIVGVATAPIKFYGWIDDWFRSAYVNKELASYRSAQRRQLMQAADDRFNSGKITKQELKAEKAKIQNQEIEVPSSVADKISDAGKNLFVNYSDVAGAVQVLRAPVNPIAGSGMSYAVHALAGMPFIAFVAGAVPVMRAWYAANPLKAQMYHNIGRYLTDMNRAEADRIDGSEGQGAAVLDLMDAVTRGGSIELRSKFPGLADLIEKNIQSDINLDGIRERYLINAAWLLPFNAFLPDIDAYESDSGVQIAGEIAKKAAQGMGNPLANVLIDLFLTNEDRFSGKPIRDESMEATDEEQIAQGLSYAFSKLLPPATPNLVDIVDYFTGTERPELERVSFGRLWEKWRATNRGELDYKNRRRTKTDMLLETFGIKGQTINSSDVIMRRALGLNKAFRTRAKKLLPKDMDKTITSLSEKNISELMKTNPREADRIIDALNKATMELEPRVDQFLSNVKPFLAVPSDTFALEMLRDAADDLLSYKLFLKDGDTVMAYDSLKLAFKSINKFKKLENALRRELRTANDYIENTGQFPKADESIIDTMLD